MSLVLNLTGGGSGSILATDAILRVLAPYGSSVSVTIGGSTKALTPIAISGDQSESCYYYIVNPASFGSATVTATLGTESDSETVAVNAAGEYTIQLSYWDGTLYYDGDEYTTYTGGFEQFAPAYLPGNPTGCSKGADTLVVNLTSGSEAWWNGAWGTVNKVDLSAFSTLHVTTTAASHPTKGSGGNISNFVAFGVQGTDSSITAKHTQVSSIGDLSPTSAEPCASLSVGDNTLDISALSEGFVWIGASSRGTGTCNLVVTKIWLT